MGACKVAYSDEIFGSIYDSSESLVVSHTFINLTLKYIHDLLYSQFRSIPRISYNSHIPVQILVIRRRWVFQIIYTTFLEFQRITFNSVKHWFISRFLNFFYNFDGFFLLIIRPIWGSDKKEVYVVECVDRSLEFIQNIPNLVKTKYFFSTIFDIVHYARCLDPFNFWGRLQRGSNSSTPSLCILFHLYRGNCSNMLSLNLFKVQFGLSSIVHILVIIYSRIKNRDETTNIIIILILFIKLFWGLLCDFVFGVLDFYSWNLW